jgi:hypothetical protein
VAGGPVGSVGAGMSEYEIEFSATVRYAAAGARQAAAMRARMHRAALHTARRLRSNGVLVRYTISDPVQVERPRYDLRMQAPA